ncbi:UPF0280 family protein [Ferrovibrio sp.]|uniref:UPF0280 family protein n=1 Tax=Ferrovibrio sp. TaxID=1917215 RepID=UPI000CAAEAA9|nr:UPF0280 family protein [Ferrovibrio sp.]PJI40286.1 MAG: hypothetical protein CTR53_11500 [Ferrovibrio sp.]
MTAPSAHWLLGRDGASRRLHLQHGPIDLVIEAFGADAARAYEQAVARFQDILSILVSELAELRQPLGAAHPLFRGPVARRMAAACWPYRDVFITPMAAVAGAVADEVLTAMLDGTQVSKVYVNNGGDIAFHVAPGESLRAAVVCNPELPHLDAIATLEAMQPSRGIATSGWRGRSFSLGIADAVTVLATNAAQADAAATIIANAVNVDHETIRRQPAHALRDDSDLGALPVTVSVGTLPIFAINEALSAGVMRAQDLRRSGLIQAAFLSLQGENRIVGGEMLLGHDMKALG